MRLEMVDTELLREEAGKVTAMQQALEATEADNRALKQLQDTFQAEKIENQSLHKELKLLSSLKPELEQARNRIKEFDAELVSLRAGKEVDAAEIHSLNARVQELGPLTKKLSDSEAQVAFLSSQIDQQIAQALALQPVQQELERFKVDAEARLKVQDHQLHTAKAKLAEAQSSLRLSQEEVSVTTAKSEELHKQIESLSSKVVDMGLLRTQIQSLTTERDLGLQRVTELSESARELGEKDKQLKQLKLEIADSKINLRELNTLRRKIERYEQDLQSRNLAIEDLKIMLRDTRKPKAKSLAKGPSVKKTATTKSRTPVSVKSETDKVTGQKDDLKKNTWHRPGAGKNAE